jgi:LmbE family N-acetylglucosaminyl deacetylase
LAEYAGEVHAHSGLTVMDVSAWLDRKVAALAAHRTQFVLEPSGFPCDVLEDWLGREYFARVALAAGIGDGYASAAEDAGLEASQWEMEMPLTVLQTA